MGSIGSVLDTGGFEGKLLIFSYFYLIFKN
jgi:hypothetical protein